MTIDQRGLHYDLLIAIIAGNSAIILESLARGAYFDRLIRLVVPEEILDFWGEVEASGVAIEEVPDLIIPEGQICLIDQARNTYYDNLRIILMQIESCKVEGSDFPQTAEELALLIESKLLSDEFFKDVKLIASKLIADFRNGVIDENSHYIYRAISEIYNFSRFDVHSYGHQYTILSESVNGGAMHCRVYLSSPIELVELSVFDCLL